MFAMPYISHMRLLNRIKQHRARLNLTQQDLAERVNVRRQTILAIEKRDHAFIAGCIRLDTEKQKELYKIRRCYC